MLAYNTPPPPSVACLRFALHVLHELDDRQPAITLSEILEQPPYSMTRDRAKTLIGLALQSSDALGGSTRV